MLTRGRLARSAGVHSETIRYYERMGLLMEPARTPSGYRQYDTDTLQRLSFIKHVQTLGFTLSEIAELLALQFDAHLSCDYLQQKAQTKVDAINTRIAALTALRETLLALARRCDTECVCRADCTALIAVAKSKAQSE
jgi:DNA-binding transcriptional MerR regulator